MKRFVLFAAIAWALVVPAIAADPSPPARHPLEAVSAAKAVGIPVGIKFYLPLSADGKALTGVAIIAADGTLTCAYVFDGQADLVQWMIARKDGPSPTPPPDPTPDPDPTPPPVTKTTALWIYEKDDLLKLPADQVAILNSQRLRDYLGTLNAESRWIDKDADVSLWEPSWQAVLKRPRTSLPWVVIQGPGGFFEGPWPGTVDGAIELARSKGGK